MEPTTTVRVDTVLKRQFANTCKKNYDLNIKEAVEILMRFILDVNVNPDDLTSIWRKSPRKDIAEYHNFTVGFLRTFEHKQNEQFAKYEKKQLELLGKLIGLLQELTSKSKVEKEVQNEILFDVQIIATLLKEEVGEKLIKRNNDAITGTETEENLKLKGL